MCGALYSKVTFGLKYGFILHQSSGQVVPGQFTE